MLDVPQTTILTYPPIPEPVFCFYASEVDRVEYRLVNTEVSQLIEFYRFVMSRPALFRPVAELESYGEEGRQGQLALEHEGIQRLDIPLRDFLPGDTGHLVIQLRRPGKKLWEWTGWIQVTDLCLSYFHSPGGSSFHTTRLGRAELVQGITEIAELTQWFPNWPAKLVVASDGADQSFLIASQPKPERRAKLQLFSDRILYHPGESIEIRGWTDREDENSEVRVTVIFGATRPVGPAHLKVSPSGHFSAGFPIPGDVTGRSMITAKIGNVNAVVDILVVPRERSAAMKGPSNTLHGRAVYYEIEGASAKERMNWMALAQVYSFSPPGWGEFKFRAQRRAPFLHPIRLQSVGPEAQNELGWLPRGLAAEVFVSSSSESGAFEHRHKILPGKVFVGVRNLSTDPLITDILKLELVVTDAQGKALAGHLVRISVNGAEAGWFESERRPVQMNLEIEALGQILVEAEVADDENRVHRSILEVYRFSQVDHAGLHLLCDRARYQVGDRLEATIYSPTRGQGFLRVLNETEVHFQNLRLEKGIQTLHLEIGAELAGFTRLHLTCISSEGVERTQQGVWVESDCRLELKVLESDEAGLEVEVQAIDRNGPVPDLEFWLSASAAQDLPFASELGSATVNVERPDRIIPPTAIRWNRETGERIVPKEPEKKTGFGEYHSAECYKSPYTLQSPLLREPSNEKEGILMPGPFFEPEKKATSQSSLALRELELSKTDKSGRVLTRLPYRGGPLTISAVWHHPRLGLQVTQQAYPPR